VTSVTRSADHPDGHLGSLDLVAARPVEYLDVRRRDVGGVTVLTVHGDLDGLTAPELTTAITNVLETRAAGLIVNLSMVDFLASAGLTALIGGAQAAVAAAKRFGVVVGGPITRRPIEITCVDEIIPVYPTVNEAVDALRTSSPAAAWDEGVGARGHRRQP
jgi:anti-sigma B factor antagonist